MGYTLLVRYWLFLKMLDPVGSRLSLEPFLEIYCSQVPASWQGRQLRADNLWTNAGEHYLAVLRCLQEKIFSHQEGSAPKEEGVDKLMFFHLFPETSETRIKRQEKGTKRQEKRVWNKKEESSCFLYLCALISSCDYFSASFSGAGKKQEQKTQEIFAKAGGEEEIEIASHKVSYTTIYFWVNFPDGLLKFFWKFKQKSQSEI